MSIGENIRRARESRSLTQCELAKSVGISQPMLAQIERGTKACSMILGAIIADKLQCSVIELYEGGESNAGGKNVFDKC